MLRRNINLRRCQKSAQTGFDLALAADLPLTEPPTAEELHVLRTRIDLTGVLRG